MTNKLDKPRGDQPPEDATPPAGTKVRKPDSGGLYDAVPPAAPDAPDVHPTNDASRPLRRLGVKTDAAMKNSSAELQARQDVIGAGLKRIFDEIVEEPVPPEFLELLDQIDRKREP
jgi:Anti-sigma factor NepR